MEKETFARLVKEALTHLYDFAFLQSHTLAELFEPRLPGESSGDMLYRMLQETIEELRPGQQVPADDRAWRPYLALYLRYVEGQEVGKVAEELAVSPRQFRREHAKALDALVKLLWTAYQQRQAMAGSAVPVAGQGGGGMGSLDVEVARLGAPGDSYALTAVDATLEGVLSTLSSNNNLLTSST